MASQDSLTARALLRHRKAVKYIFVLCASFLLLLLTALSVLANPPQSPQEVIPFRGPTTAQGNEEHLTLELGKPIERELVGGKVHNYRIALSAGQYARVVVEQQTIDVVVALFGPDGGQIVELDRARIGREPVSALAEPPGSYRLEVRPLEKGAAAGRYEVRLAELQPSTPQDKKRAAAERLYAEATRLVKPNVPESSRKAIEILEKTLPLFQAADDSFGEACALNMMGGSSGYLDEHRKAIIYFDRALPLRRLAGDRSGEAVTLTSTGRVYAELYEYQKALDYYNQALPLRRAIGDRPGEGGTLRLLAGMYDILGDYGRGLECLNQALPLARIEGNRSNEASTLTSIGKAHDLLGDKQKALDYFHQALAIFRSIGIRSGESTVLNNIGAIYKNLREKEKALAYLNQALQLRQELGNLQGKGVVLANIGRVYEMSGEYEKALDYYNQSLPLRRATGDLRGETGTLYDMARVERSRGHLSEALAHIEATLDIAESLRIKVASQRLRASYLASRLSYYELKIDLLMRLHRERPAEGFDARALQASERGHARSLLDLLTEAGANIRQAVEPSLLELERSVQKALNAKATEQEKLLAGKHTAEQAAALDREIQTLTSEYEQVQSQIRQKSPRYAALVEPTPLGLKEIQQLLDPDTLLLEYSLGRERSYLWAITQTSIHSYDLPKDAEIEEQAKRLYTLLTVRNRRDEKAETDQQRSASLVQAEAECSKAAGELSQTLLGPVAAQLDKKRLVVVADGALHYLPFAALPDPSASGQHLIVDHELVSLPSASVLGVLRQESEGRKLASKSVAVMADPVFDGKDMRVRGTSKAKEGGAGSRADHSLAKVTDKTDTAPTREIDRAAGEAGLTGDSDQRRIRRLPFSRDEAEMILASVPAASAMKALDFKASRETATSGELGQYRIVHFATHGLLNGEHPELSGIVLSLVDKDGRERDGFLRLHEVYNLRLPVELVVLSACQTALGKQVKGEGLVGLVRGFMYAGSKRVVASLWKVDDEATAELMKIFYRGMFKEGMRPAAALQAAKVEMSGHKRWHSPYYWAAFELQGEWR
jgi:CHAT domain-containing protein/Tfp pilus assembly protein PilF